MTVERGGGELRAEEEENCGLIFFYLCFISRQIATAGIIFT